MLRCGLPSFLLLSDARWSRKLCNLKTIYVQLKGLLGQGPVDLYILTRT